jgi:hypothetical protein
MGGLLAWGNKVLLNSFFSTAFPQLLFHNCLFSTTFSQLLTWGNKMLLNWLDKTSKLGCFYLGALGGRLAGGDTIILTENDSDGSRITV